MSGGHCTHPTGGPAIRLKHKKPPIVDSLLLVFPFFLLHDEMTLGVLSSSVKIKLSSLLVHFYIILMLSCK